jgi:hypothetical protein
MNDRVERGPKGDHGQQGDTGLEGPRGKNNWIPWIAAILAFVLMGILLQRSIHKTNHLVRQNRVLIQQIGITKADITSLRKVNIASCKNFTILKDAVNDFHGTIHKFLLTARNARSKAAANPNDPNRTADLQAAKIYDQLLKNTRTVKADCAQKQDK